LNGRKNEMVVRVVRTVIGFLPFAGKPMNVASAQSRIIGKKIPARLSPEGGDLRVHWLMTTSREPCHRHRDCPESAKGVWTAPAVQEESDSQRSVRV